MSGWIVLILVLVAGVFLLRHAARVINGIVDAQVRELREIATSRSIVSVKKLSGEAVVPQYMTGGSAAADLVAAQDVLVQPGKRALIGTGISAAIPEGHVGLICPRSGMALKRGVTVANAPGVIDSDYRGEWKVILANLSDWPFRVEKGMRVAQVLVMPVRQFWFFEVGELDATERGSGGFGHTGA
jgi:dUTP pyrophosphatase